MKLTSKQELFVTEYIKDLNATQAAIRAGYNSKAARQIASENLSKPYIKSKIDEYMHKKAMDNDITAEFVLNGIKGIAVSGEKESDQLKAYELLGKYLKLFTDKIESDVKANVDTNISGEIKHNMDLSKLSVEELKQLESIINKSSND